MRVDQLVGIWKLDNLYVENNKSGRKYPFGDAVMGQLVLTATGIFSAHVYGELRARSINKYQSYESEDEARGILGKSVSYYGHYKFDNSSHKLTLSVVGALDPAWEGGEQERVVTMENGKLMLSTSPIEWNGQVIVTHLEWTEIKA